MNKFRAPSNWGWRGALALALALSSCQPAPRPAAQRAEPPRPREIFWNRAVHLPDRERIEADVSLFGVHAAAFNMELSHSCDTAAADDLELRSKMSTAGLVRFFKTTDGNSFTTMGSQRARPTRSELSVLDGDTRRTYRATLAPGSASTTIEKTGAPLKRLTEQTPRGEHPLDMPSAFMLLRHWQAERGARGYFYVLLGRHLWHVDVHFHGEVTLRAEPERESRRAIEIDGRAERVKVDSGVRADPRRFTLWLSPNPSRVPLRVEGDASFGTVNFVLTGHESSEHAGSGPGGHCSPQPASAHARMN